MYISGHNTKLSIGKLNMPICNEPNKFLQINYVIINKPTLQSNPILRYLPLNRIMYEYLHHLNIGMDFPTIQQIDQNIAYLFMKLDTYLEDNTDENSDIQQQHSVQTEIRYKYQEMQLFSSQLSLTIDVTQQNILIIILIQVNKKLIKLND